MDPLVQAVLAVPLDPAGLEVQVDPARRADPEVRADPSILVRLEGQSGQTFHLAPRLQEVPVDPEALWPLRARVDLPGLVALEGQAGLAHRVNQWGLGDQEGLEDQAVLLHPARPAAQGDQVAPNGQNEKLITQPHQ